MKPKHQLIDRLLKESNFPIYHRTPCDNGIFFFTYSIDAIRCTAYFNNDKLVISRVNSPHLFSLSLDSPNFKQQLNRQLQNMFNNSQF